MPTSNLRYRVPTLRRVVLSAAEYYIGAHFLFAQNRWASPYIGGFSYFVTSIAAPIASGRSDLAGWDFHTLEKRRLITAHTHSSHRAPITDRLVSRGKRPVDFSDPTGTVC